MKWAVDAMLGDVARCMIILGEDVLYRSDYSGVDLARIAREEDRIFLTTSVRRFPNPPDTAYLIIPMSVDSLWDKLRFVKRRFSISFKVENLFSRCILCNTLTTKIFPDKKPAEIPQKVFMEFVLYQCPRCKKIYWKGGHFEHTKKKLLEESILN